MKEHTAILSKLCARDEIKGWAENQINFEECWNNFKQSDWMLCMIRKLDNIDINFYKKYACFCARQNWHLLTDQCSRDGIIAAEEYIAGKISINKMKVARKNAAKAATAATAAYADARVAHAVAATILKSDADSAYAAEAAAANASFAAHAAAHAAHAAFAANAAKAAYAADAAAANASIANVANAADVEQIEIDQCNWIRSQISLAEIMERIGDYFQ